MLDAHRTFHVLGTEPELQIQFPVVRVEVPSAFDVPLVHWLNDLRREVLAVVEARR